jgi:hypothetical protein
MVDYFMALTMGSTTTFGTNGFLFSLPVAAAIAGGSPMGNAWMVDASAGARVKRFGLLWSATTIAFMDVAGAHVAATVPWTWANTDTLFATGRYLAAS